MGMNTELSQTGGTIIYHETWIVCYLDKNFSDYYFSLIPPYKKKNRQKYPPHVTVIRKDVEKINQERFITSLNGATVPILYNPEIQFSHPYYYLDAYSPVLCWIRTSAGLPRYRKPFTSFHITIANCKGWL